MKTALQRTGLLGFTLSLIFASFTCADAQQAAPPQIPSVIHFFVPVDYASVNQLITTVDQQIRSGTKDITILLSSPGGDPAAGLAAYNYLRVVNANITTYNLGVVDSAATLVFCAGKTRYAVAGTRFLIHGASMNQVAATALDATTLDAQLQQIKSINAMMLQVVGATIKPKSRSDAEAAIRGQKILSPEEAKDWGLISDTRDPQMVPGSIVSVIHGGSDAQPTVKQPSVVISISGDAISD